MHSGGCDPRIHTDVSSGVGFDLQQFSARLAVLLRLELHERGCDFDDCDQRARAGAGQLRRDVIGDGELPVDQRVADLQQRNFLRLQRDRSGLAGQHGEFLDGNPEFRVDFPGTEWIFVEHDGRAFDARVFAGKYGGGEQLRLFRRCGFVARAGDAGSAAGAVARFAKPAGVWLAGNFATFESGGGQYFCGKHRAGVRHGDGDFSDGLYFGAGVHRE